MIAAASPADLARIAAPFGVALAVRPIRPGDEDALLPEERDGFCAHAPRARRQSGAARKLARELIAERFGLRDAPILRAADRSPIWPARLVGSLAHDDAFCAAAIALASAQRAVGVDIEPDAPLDEDLVARVATAAERGRYPPEILRSRALFVAKEAAYKASYPLDGALLDFLDIEVDLDACRARIATGRAFTLVLARTPHWLALAIPA